jgi:UDP-N-acetylmuramoylalanine--D-glutamate ligase
MSSMDLKDKKVLLVGLGILGGGLATAKWLLEKEADLSITDLKTEEELKDSIEELKGFEIKYTLGEHKEEDLKDLDFVVLNPDVPFDSPFVEEIKKRDIPIENELTLFSKELPTKNFVAITGTRGKTTTVNWTGFLMNEILGNTVIAGNSPKEPFLNSLKKINKDSFVVAEVPSFQLEVIEENLHPKVSVITNIYRDHINRHYDEENYARIKGNIFRGQGESDFVVLNKENKWTDKFLKELASASSGVAKGNKPEVIMFPDEGLLPELPEDFGEHNKQNLMIAMSVLKIFGGDLSKVPDLISKLPQIKFRQEVIYEDENLKVINDTTSTSPEAAIAAVERFKGDDLILLTGGTDKGLHYESLSKYLNENISNERLVLLSGSATEKMKEHLKFENLNEFDTLEECLQYAKYLKGKKTIVFSPGSKSFEKFNNEMHRGDEFNRLFKEVFNVHP